MPERARIFIIYAGPDAAHATALARALRALDRPPFVDRLALKPGDPWDTTILRALADAELIAVLVTPRWTTHDAHYAHDEVARAIDRYRTADDPITIVPVVMGDVPPLRFPSGIARFVSLPATGDDWPATARALVAVLDGERIDDAPQPGDRVHAAPRLSIGRLPTPGGPFVGRDDELAALDAAWADDQLNLHAIIGTGGEGKTALVGRWLDRMKRDRWRGAARVYGWSFYSQGAGEDRQVSADLFIATLLKWLGDPRPAEGDAHAKAARLAALLREQRTLLVLDGIEPLQFGPGESYGRVKDPALRALLRELRADLCGLCVLTSRVTPHGLEDGGPVRLRTLPPLDPERGAELLRLRGVHGADDALRAASTEVKGHALALNLLGGYLAMYADGDIRRRDTIDSLLDAEDGGGHARRVMVAYDRLLEDTDRQALRVVGLFDRAAEPAPLAALLATPPIAGLTDALGGIEGKGWLRAVKHLRDLGLLLAGERADDLDAHPLVRAHFGAVVEAEAPTAWVEAHGRLFDHFAGAAELQPDDLPGMTPLFRAVHHGCAAGRHRQAFQEVLMPRIYRDEEGYVWRRLGAFSQTLTALTSFFVRPWSELHATMTELNPSYLRSEVAFLLRGLGRPVESLALMRDAIYHFEIMVGIGTADPLDPDNSDLVRSLFAATTALVSFPEFARKEGNIAELLILLGRLDDGLPDVDSAGRSTTTGAIHHARCAVDYASHGLGIVQLTEAQCRLADALHQRGRMRSACALFETAEAQYGHRTESGSRLVGLNGYRFGELLLRGRVTEVRSRALESLRIAEQDNDPHEIGLAKLLLARSRLAEGNAGPESPARLLMDEALTQFRQLGAMEFIAHALVYRAALLRHLDDPASAKHSLDEARDIAASGMRLVLADAHLEAAHQALARGDRAAAEAEYTAARDLIAATAYHRRDPELATLAAALDVTPPPWLGQADVMVDIPLADDIPAP